MSARGLLALCLALVAAAPLSAQQRDVTGLFDDAGAAAGEAEAIGAPEDAGATLGAAPEPPGPGEPALAPEDDAPALPDGHVPTLTVRLTPDSGLLRTAGDASSTPSTSSPSRLARSPSRRSPCGSSLPMASWGPCARRRSA
jgi:hypothetical protein